MTPAPLTFPDDLTDGVVALRAWREEDVPEIVRACQDPEIPRWTLVPSPYDEDTARWWLGEVESAHADGRWCALGVFGATNGELLGSVGLVGINHEHGVGEIGYWCAAWARGRGATTRAVRIISGWAFGDLGMTRIEIMAEPGNLASQRVAERAGFTREGLLRSYREMKGRRVDLVMWSLLAEEVSERPPP